jgi:N-acyl-phosphatidylethanolamine-hydrolysing phospholipase D
LCRRPRATRRWPAAGPACALILLLVAADISGLAAQTVTAPAGAHHRAHGFRNLDDSYSYSMLDRASRVLRRLSLASRPRGEPFERAANDGAALRANGTAPTITWVGHATMLVQLEGLNIVTDPHWGRRASPVRFIGPKRMIPPGLRFEDLPAIHAVIISHDHYDHLDAETVARITRAHDAVFFIPLGGRALLARMGARHIVELDWWQASTLGRVRFVCTPAQHSSGRTALDQNDRLWSSWAVIGQAGRFFFAGDTGYSTDFREIGRRLGPFDATAVPVGGYSAYSRRHPNHVNPEEAVQLFEDVRGRLLVPMHWGTFDMNSEPFAEPPERLLREARRRGLEAQMKVLAPGQTLHW